MNSDTNEGKSITKGTNDQPHNFLPHDDYLCMSPKFSVKIKHKRKDREPEVWFAIIYIGNRSSDKKEKKKRKKGTIRTNDQNIGRTPLGAQDDIDGDSDRNFSGTPVARNLLFVPVVDVAMVVGSSLI